MFVERDALMQQAPLFSDKTRQKLTKRRISDCLKSALIFTALLLDDKAGFRLEIGALPDYSTSFKVYNESL